MRIWNQTNKTTSQQLPKTIIRGINIRTPCTQAWAKIGPIGVPNFLAFNIQGVERGVKSAKKWQKNRLSNSIVFIFDFV